MTASRRLGATLLAVALFALAWLVVLGHTVAIPSVERHLVHDIQRHVVGSQTISVTASGRTVQLQGTVANDEQRRRLVERIRHRWGVSHVDADGVRVAQPAG